MDNDKLGAQMTENDKREVENTELQMRNGKCETGNKKLGTPTAEMDKQKVHETVNAKWETRNREHK